jgi:hypothetical protein
MDIPPSTLAFFERMQQLGALSIRAGEVEVSFAPGLPRETRYPTRPALSEEEEHILAMTRSAVGG